MARNQIASLTDTVTATAYVSCVVHKNKKKFICIQNIVVNNSIEVDHLWLCADSFSDHNLIQVIKSCHRGQRVSLSGKVSEYLKYDTNRNLVKDYCLTEIDTIEVTQIKRSVRYESSRYYQGI